jgi:MoaA/NifB/PqqE/SkfB family radical SAM enzyme
MKLRDPLPGLRRSVPQRIRDHVSKRRNLPVNYHYPDTVYIVPSNACNYRCRACPKSVHPTDNRMLEDAVYERVRTRLFPHARQVVLQGLGEPTLSPHFFPLLRDARDMGLQIEFTTNASLITEENAAEIISSPAQMTISIDGSCAKTHEDSRPGAEFGQLLRALEIVKNQIARGPVNDRFRFCSNTVVTTRNLQEIEGIIDLAADHGAVNLTLIAPGMGERQDPFAQDAIGNHEQLFASRIPAIVQHAEQRGITLTLPPYTLNNQSGENLASDGAANAKLFPQQCSDPWRVVYIDVDGWVRPCCRGISIAMGNILDDDFWDIWNGKHYFRLRQTINSDAPPSFCRNCTLPWGITGGDPAYESKLKARGVTLAPAPSIGISWDRKSKTMVED